MSGETSATGKVVRIGQTASAINGCRREAVTAGTGPVPPARLTDE